MGVAETWAEVASGAMAPATADAELATPEILSRVLDQLSQTGVLEAFLDGPEPVYAVAATASRSSAYYRNGLIHFTVVSAIADMALLHVAEQQTQGLSTDACVTLLHEEALRLRDILKFEFFFEDKDAFIAVMEQELTLRAPNWRDTLDQGRTSLLTLMWEMNPLLAPGTLRPFLESYHLVAESLLMDSTDSEAPTGPVDSAALVKQSLSLGQQRVMQGRVNSEESVSQTYLDNGIKVAESRGIFSAEKDQRQATRQALEAELAELVRRIGFLASVAENRRQGEVPPFVELQDQNSSNNNNKRASA